MCAELLAGQSKGAPAAAIHKTEVATGLAVTVQLVSPVRCRVLAEPLTRTVQDLSPLARTSRLET